MIGFLTLKDKINKNIPGLLGRRNIFFLASLVYILYIYRPCFELGVPMQNTHVLSCCRRLSFSAITLYFHTTAVTVIKHKFNYKCLFLTIKLH